MSFVSCYPKWAGSPSSVLPTLMIPLAVLQRTLASVVPLIPPLMPCPIVEIDELGSLATDQLVEATTFINQSCGDVTGSHLGRR